MIYAMQVAERLDLDSYYHDERFRRKRPGSRTWRQRCGDNIYYRNQRGRYVQDPNAVYHLEPDVRSQDLWGDRAYISTHYFYFGEEAVPVPRAFSSLIRCGRGVRYHAGPIVEDFIDWIEMEYRPGIHGLPRDRERCTVGCSAAVVCPI